MAEGGRLERHGVNRASLSGRARHPGRFTFHVQIICTVRTCCPASGTQSRIPVPPRTHASG